MVEFPSDQTCCGQPAYNTGDWDAARRIARHAASVFGSPLPVVAPSGSCARMVTHGVLQLFDTQPDPRVSELAGRTWELADYIVNVLGRPQQWPGRMDSTVALHRSCHGRGTPMGDAARTLLDSIVGLRVLELGDEEACCGFGGTFSVAFPGISRRIGQTKLDAATSAGVSAIVSADMGCLMHLDGLAKKESRSLPTLHIAQVLRDALRTAGREGTA